MYRHISVCTPRLNLTDFGLSFIAKRWSNTLRSIRYTPLKQIEFVCSASNIDMKDYRGVKDLLIWESAKWLRLWVIIWENWGLIFIYLFYWRKVDWWFLFFRIPKSSITDAGMVVLAQYCKNIECLDVSMTSVCYEILRYWNQIFTDSNIIQKASSYGIRCVVCASGPTLTQLYIGKDS